MEQRDAFYVDGVRTWYGKAKPDGYYYLTRADDMATKIIRELMRRNPNLPPDEVDDNIWGATVQSGDQGTTLGRCTVLTSGLPFKTAGMSLDRMCAGGMTAQAFGGSLIKTNAADVVIAGGVEHMSHHPIGKEIDPNPRLVTEQIVDPKYFNMGITAERLHDWMVENGYPAVTREESDEYAYRVQKRYFKALEAGYYDSQIVQMAVFTSNGWQVTERDQQARIDVTLESMKSLKSPFKSSGKVTAGNSSGLNDGASGSLIISGEKCRELGIQPKMRLIGYAFEGVDPSIMGWGPIPVTEKVLKRYELNEAFAVQALAFMKYFNMNTPEDPRLNPFGGTLAIGHPLATSGVRLSIQLAKDFELNPKARYGLCAMCVGLGMGGATLWERV